LILEKTNHLIKNAHTSNIICFSNCSDPIKKLTYLLSCSYDRSIKIWIPENKWENVINISDAHYDYSIFSAQIFYHIIKKEIFIISSNFNEKIIKIWDSNKNCIKAINESGVKFINWWYDSELEKYYLISVNNTEINSYEFLNIHIYTTFNPDDQSTPTSALVNKYGHLIESDSKGTIRVWDFHSAELISVIIRGSNKFKITGINLLDEEILLAASSDKFVLVYDLRENKFLKSFSSHNNEVFTVKSFYHPIHNKIFASYGFDCKIKLWY
jgi:WD40 repeat protein